MHEWNFLTIKNLLQFSLFPWSRRLPSLLIPSLKRRPQPDEHEPHPQHMQNKRTLNEVMGSPTGRLTTRYEGKSFPKKINLTLLSRSCSPSIASPLRHGGSFAFLEKDKIIDWTHTLYTGLWKLHGRLFVPVFILYRTETYIGWMTGIAF